MARIVSDRNTLCVSIVFRQLNDFSQGLLRFVREIHVASHVVDIVVCVCETWIDSEELYSSVVDAQTVLVSPLLV